MFSRENELKKKHALKPLLVSILKYREDTYVKREMHMHMHSSSYKEILPYY